MKRNQFQTYVTGYKWKNKANAIPSYHGGVPFQAVKFIKLEMVVIKSPLAGFELRGNCTGQCGETNLSPCFTGWTSEFGCRNVPPPPKKNQQQQTNQTTTTKTRTLLLIASRPLLLLKFCSDRQFDVANCYLMLAINWSNVSKGVSHQLIKCQQGYGVVSEHNYTQARYHYLHSEDGQGCAAMLLEYHTIQGYASEVDLFITQAVLQ